MDKKLKFFYVYVYIYSYTNANMQPNIYTLNNAVHREKMVAFDYDWTLVCPKGGKTFPSNIDDWERFTLFVI